jgi:hypothetical protein
MVHLSFLDHAGMTFIHSLIDPTSKEITEVISGFLAQGFELLAIEYSDSELEAWIEERVRMTEDDLLNAEKMWC